MLKTTLLLDGHTSSVNSVRWTSDGEYAVSCSNDKTIKLWNPLTSNFIDNNKNQKNISYIKSYGDNDFNYPVLASLSFHDKTSILGCGKDLTVNLYDVLTGKLLRKYKPKINLASKLYHSFNCLAINSHDSIFGVGSFDKTVTLFDLRSSNNGSVIQVLDNFKDSVSCINILNDTILCSSIDGSLYRYDLRNSSLILDSFNKSILHFSVSDNEALGLISCLPNTLSLFDLETGKILKEFQGHVNNEFKTESCFSNDYSIVFSGSEDGKIYHWEVKNKDENKNIDDIPLNTSFENTLVHQSHILSLNHSPVDNYILSSSYDGKIFLSEYNKK